MSATIRVVDPNPDVHRVIVRSLYIFENSSQADFIEFGWKWLIDEAASSYPPGDDFDFEPTVFAVRQSAFTYILSEHATLNPGTNHAFRIEANVDGSHPSTFYFFVDGQDSGDYFHGNMQNGFVVSGSESNALCDSLFTHHWNMQRETGAGWNTWSNVVKLTAGFGFPDRSKWWYFDKLSNGEYRLEHCGTANCGDVN